MKRETNDALTLDNFNVKSQGLDIQGEAKLGHNLRVKSATINKISIDNLIDGRITANRELSDSPLKITIDGDYLNLEELVGSSISGARERPLPPILMTANIASLRLAPNYFISDSILFFGHSGETIDYFRFNGDTDKGPFKFDLRKLKDGPYLSLIHI